MGGPCTEFLSVLLESLVLFVMFSKKETHSEHIMLGTTFDRVNRYVYTRTTKLYHGLFDAHAQLLLTTLTYNDESGPLEYRSR